MTFQTLQAVVFDWAGTVIDFGSQAPMGAFVELFARHQVAISIAEARGPMGLPKWHHIQALGQQPRIAAAWHEAHGRPFSDGDVDALYEEFTPMNAESVKQHATLIAGAADGAGIGDRFLGHIERCRVLIHLIDITGTEDADPAEAMRIVEDELAAYGAGLEDKARLVVLNKLDLADAELVEAYRAELLEAGADEVFAVSGVTGAGIPELLDAVLGYLPASTSTETKAEEIEDEDDAPEWSPL